MKSFEEFYRLRDQRTTDVIGSPIPTRAVHIAASEKVVTTVAGQHLVLSLTNMVARIHRSITFDFPDAALLTPSPFGGQTIRSAVLQTAAAIDPYGSFEITGRPADDAVRVGVGGRLSLDCEWYLGASGAIAILDRQPSAIDAEAQGIRGAALAACLGAAAVTKTVLAIPVTACRLSAWNFEEGTQAAIGPANLPILNVGNVLMVGAGAVASAFAYWAYTWGVGGFWAIVDRDIVKLHNTNRGLLFLPRHSDWFGTTAQNKAEILSQFLPGSAIPKWYDEAEELKEKTFDVILALANERNVRTLLGHLNSPVLMHATTGRSWLAQLHRHIASVDDCIDCRFGDVPAVGFECSEAKISTAAETSADAALPFLSAAAGLMLLTGLQRLESGTLLSENINDWRLDFRSAHRMATSGRRHCRKGCGIWWPDKIRRKAYAGTRWVNVH